MSELVRADDAASGLAVCAPVLIANAGPRAERRFLEFFAVTIRNRNTRAAYLRACRSFFAFCDAAEVDEIDDIEPLHVAAYVEALGHARSTPTVKQHLAALRMLFDWLVTGQIIATNPAHAVRGPKQSVAVGKTPVLTPEEARQILDAIPLKTHVGLRDRALIALMVFSFARISAALACRVQDYAPRGKRWWLRLHEKGGKIHEMPVHHTLEACLDAYIDAAGLREDPDGWLFRAARGRTGKLSERPFTRQHAWQMVRRRARAAGITQPVGNHSFRATGITAYLANNGSLEHAQRMAAHASPRTTKLYDRTGEEVTLDEVEKIVI
ncbi:MAG: tyrosine-type recombinase/integrase [Pseudomonadota bacterium]